ncbi:Mu transposase domain-containing protein [Kitasatospora sp. DSM 101779]|uniref:Mu transposase domain-containing protein n=1 Tax=Kitasatospora sp. DSM 101779 TaxID=2853165 RepID=UPI0021DAA925|nr:IS21 family transposase [Kitasatospora sp. DSM 101779]MCU7827059.1 IS21 family transposase [Kitasatospora sp. DSM 101779]
MRSYLLGGRTPGVRNSPQDAFGQFVPYCRQRLRDDPHLEATVLLKEVTDLGYRGGYSTLTRALRRHRLRPVCTQCRCAGPNQETDTTSTAGDELRFTWLKLLDPPPLWGVGSHAHVLIGALPSGLWRASLAENEDLAQVIEAVDLVLRRLGRTGRYWWFDSVPAVNCRTSGKVKPELVQVARHYGVDLGTNSLRPATPSPPAPDPLRPIEDFWWRTVRPDTRLHVAQESLDHFAAWLDSRHSAAGSSERPGDVVGGGHDARTHGPGPLPPPFPATIRVARTVAPHDLVSFRGNYYAVPPGLVGARVDVSWRLDEPHLSISTTGGAVIARHAVAPRGAGRIVVGPGHTITLEHPQGRRQSDRTPCNGRTRLPPSPEALVHARAFR